MKALFIYVTWLFSLGAFLSCDNRKEADIDTFIVKYAREDFSFFRGISIFQRSAGINDIIYGIGLSGAEKPLYFVEYDLIQEEVTTINNILVKEAGYNDYLTNQQIEKYISNFRRYKFYLLSVDDSNNVFVNPYSANSPALLMRMHHANGEKIVRKGFVYELYKGNWYLNRSR